MYTETPEGIDNDSWKGIFKLRVRKIICTN